MQEQNITNDVFANIGIYNIVDLADADVTSAICKTLDRFYNILKRHAGPNSRYSMFGANNKGYVAEFTRDGINIMRNIECKSPLEDYLRQILVYIGGLVDTAAKDNTTTAMMLASKFLHNVLSGNSIIKSKSPYAVAKLLADQVYSIVTAMRIYRIDDIVTIVSQRNPELTGLEARREAIRSIAYAQAMSSSGGNIELAMTVSELFADTPEVCIEYVQYSNTPSPMQHKFAIDVNEYDYCIDCTANMDPLHCFNHALGTEYIDKKVNVLLCIEPLIEGTLSRKLVADYIATYEDTTPLVVLSARYDAVVLNAALSSTAKVTCWAHDTSLIGGGHPYLGAMYLAQLLSKGNNYLTDNGMDAGTLVKLVNDVDVHWQNGAMQLTNFYAKNDSHSNLHPYYQDVLNNDLSKPEVKLYHKELISVKDALFRAKHARVADDNLYKLYVDILHTMTSYHRKCLLLGGSNHDCVAANSVVQDVLGAIQTSLLNGFVDSSLVTMYINAKTNYEISADESLYPLYDALRCIADDIYKDNCGRSIEEVVTTSKYNMLSDDVVGDVCVDIVEQVHTDSFRVLQPSRAITNMLNTTIDITGKILCASEMTIPGYFSGRPME